MRARGFTLLEVMVAVAILGLALTVILSAQAGLYAAGTHAQRETVAIGLARCKMGEVEEELLRDGYPELDQNEQGVCCEDSESPGFSCVWKVEKVELPQPPTFGEQNPAGEAGESIDSLGAMTGNDPNSMLPKGTGAFGALFAAGSNDAGILQSAGGADGGVAALSNMLGAATTGGVAGIAPLVMGIVYPSLKPMLEASIRKVTVQVVWREGVNERNLTVQQYLTNPMRGGLNTTIVDDPNAVSTDPSASTGTGSGSGLSTGRGSNLTGKAGGGFNKFGGGTK